MPDAALATAARPLGSPQEELSAEAEAIELVAERLDEIAVEADIADIPDAPAESAEQAAAVLETAPVVEAAFVATPVSTLLAEASSPPAIEAASTADAGTPPDGALTPPLPQASDGGPDESWTLVRLRAEARSRGLKGVSSLNKSALLQRLRS